MIEGYHRRTSKQRLSDIVVNYVCCFVFSFKVNVKDVKQSGGLQVGRSFKGGRSSSAIDLGCLVVW